MIFMDLVAMSRPKAAIRPSIIAEVTMGGSFRGAAEVYGPESAANRFLDRGFRSERLR